MRRTLAVAALAVASLTIAAAPARSGPITITILHTNDMHAHVEPFTVGGKEMGGYARQATLIQRFRQSDPNPLLLCAGDTFQGTLYFNVYEGLADLAYMNFAGYRAMTVGNHEFDRGPKALGRFARLARFPLVAANLDVTHDPDLTGIIKPSVVLEVGGETIGIVGAVPEDLLTITTPGPTVRVKETVPSIQAAVDDLTRRGVDKVILLSHLGFAVDTSAIAHLSNVDVVVGGHSHSLLGTVADLPQPRGPYPTVSHDADGHPVPVVQAWEWGKVLGRIQVTFDEHGVVTGWANAAPVPVDASIPEDATVKSMVAALELPLATARDQAVGYTDEGIPTTKVTSRQVENPMANVIADAMLAATATNGSIAAFVNAGGVRAGIDAGEITFGDAIAVQPFNNTLVQIDLTGAELQAVLNETLGVLLDNPGGLLYPSRGTSYVIDLGRAPGERVRDLLVDGKPVEAESTYRITVPSFAANGGDNHAILATVKGRRYDTGLLDIDALVEYLRANSPLDGRLEGRVTIQGN